MAKCSRCGRKGLFLKLKNGLCSNCEIIVQNEHDIQESEAKLDELCQKLADQKALFEQIEAKAQASAMEKAMSALKTEREKTEKAVESARMKLRDALSECEQAKAAEEKSQKASQSAIRKVEKSRSLIKSIDHAISMFQEHPIEEMKPGQTALLVQNVNDFLSPSVTLELQCLSMKELRKRYRQNEKNIQDTLEKYRGRYTTKANIAIYNLMVIALEAELQNVLYSIRFGKLDDALGKISEITRKYYTIATDGNQSIAPTVKKFIGEIDFYFQEAVRIEYEYYVQKERAKEEQRTIREQMRQEAEDRRALEAEKKKIEREESKFQGQITQLEEQLQSTAESDKVAQLEARLEELRLQLNAVQEKREEITTLQNGKAGNVYVISNLGSFGDDVFKIGMTRRLEPQDRIDELGSASIPFPFDVHSFIFSDDAVALENKIHKILNDRRVNKVNLRKEFFRISLDELEALVAELAPTAEFRRTMLAEQYHQSLSIDHVTDVVDDADTEGEDDDIS